MVQLHSAGLCTTFGANNSCALAIAGYISTPSASSSLRTFKYGNTPSQVGHVEYRGARLCHADGRLGPARRHVAHLVHTLAPYVCTYVCSARLSRTIMHLEWANVGQGGGHFGWYICAIRDSTMIMLPSRFSGCDRDRYCCWWRLCFRVLFKSCTHARQRTAANICICARKLRALCTLHGIIRAHMGNSPHTRTAHANTQSAAAVAHTHIARPSAHEPHTPMIQRMVKHFPYSA